MIRLLLAEFTLAVAFAAPALAQQPEPARGRNLAAACANCHGTNGVSQAGIPSLAGRDRPGILQQMQDFKAGRRPATVMHQIAKGYTDEQIDAIAAYLSAQKAR
jgi:cytochrome subunit of sulfide dehydrogenase